VPRASLLNVDIRRSRERCDVPFDGSSEAPRADIRAYWESLRGARPFPSTGDLDARKVAYYWSNCLLMRRIPHSPLLEVERVFASETRTALGGSNSLANDRAVFVAALILDIGQKARRQRAPVEELEHLPLPTGRRLFRAVALPFSDDPPEVDHVLCHLEPAF
jgi:hypothetical protein